MKPPVMVVIALILVGSVAAYFYWGQNQLKSEPVVVQALPPPLLPPEPEKMRQVIDVSPGMPPLPALAESDNFILDALAGLIGNKSLTKLFHTEKIIRNIVATIDSLTTSHISMRVMPVEPAPGRFITSGKEDSLIISTKNAARYMPYVKISESINAQKLVGLYIRLYPLFQQAYEELGYPNKYFNDRLIQTIDNLLDTPIIKEPIRLVQPNVLYLYADPDLENRSIGQKILMRTGNENELIIKSKLREIKQELILHMHEKKVEGAGL